MRPFRTYNGGKGSDGTFQQIINLIPPHDVFFEGFAGSGAITMKKIPAATTILFDTDPEVIGSWDRWKKNFPLLDHPDLQMYQLNTLDFLDIAWPFINVMAKHTRLFFYLDPPYPRETRSCQKKLYHQEMTTEDHQRLLNSVVRYQCPVMISSYRNDMYDKALNNWSIHNFTGRTRHGTRTETLYFNYSIPEYLHDYTYLGDNYRERENIKGRITRNIRKIKNMATTERNYLLHELNKIYKNGTKTQI